MEDSLSELLVEFLSGEVIVSGGGQVFYTFPKTTPFDDWHRIRNSAEKLCRIQVFCSSPRTISFSDYLDIRWLIQGIPGVHLAVFIDLQIMTMNLMNKGVDYNQADGEGITSLHLAAKYEHVSTMHLLLRQGSNMNLTTKY